jgi:ribosomal-protein-alanine N-acetyltransferase
MTIESALGTFPQLETRRLRLREIEEHDAEQVYAIFSDPLVMEYYNCDPFSDLDVARTAIAKISEKFRTKTGIRWGITLKNEDLVIGTCGYNSLVPMQFRGEIGYDLNRDYWKQGIMCEALQAMLAFGFDQMELHKIEAEVMLGNDASDRLLKKLGFKEEGVLRKHGFWKGAFHDLRIFGLLNEDFVASLNVSDDPTE